MNFASKCLRILASTIGDQDMRKNRLGLSLSPLALLTLAACGGGGKSGSSGSSGRTVNGNVQKGPLYDAIVFLDYNNDELYDDGSGFNAKEPSTRSDVNGDFTLTSSHATVTTTYDGGAFT